MTYKFVVAADPGGTTGVATRLPNGHWMTCVCSTPEELYDIIKPYVVSGKLEHIIIENFAAQTISTYGLHTVRIVGGVQALCHVFGIPLTIHNPQDRYPFKTNAKLMLVQRGAKHMVHEMDALSHLLRWESDNKIGE